MRTLAIGDIHGSLRALKQALQRAQFDPTTDKCIFLGDYLDGWSENVELILFLISIKKLNHEHIFLMGNHDEGIAEFVLTGKTGMMVDIETKRQFIHKAAIVNAEVKKFFSELRVFYIDEENRAFVHGGYTSIEGVGHETHDYMYYWDRQLWYLAFSRQNDEQLPELLRCHKEIYIGHTATINFNTDKPMNACNVWNLDTGAGWGHKVTVMDIETKEYWQSDMTKDLHPDEKCRG